MALTYCLTFVVSLLVGLFVTYRVRNFAVAHRIGTTEMRARDVHSLPVPRVGGAAIYAAFLIVVAGLLLLRPFVSTLSSVTVIDVWRLILPATLIFALGLYDDLFSASPWLKIGVQSLAVVPIYMTGLRVVSLPVLAGHHNFGAAVSFAATLLWVLLITNAFNLVDGLDGLAAGSALFSMLVMFVMALVNGSLGITFFALVLVGVTAGFLRFNFNPATIFLGDSGSLFIGFVLSILALAARSKSSTMLAVAIPIVSFGLPLMETGLSLVRRFLSGQPLFRADRQHIHHKLLERGFTHRQVVIILYAVSGGCALMSALLLQPSGPEVGIVLFVLGGGIWIGVQHLRYPEIFELARVARRTIQQKQVIVNNLAIHRAAEQVRAAADMAELQRVLRQGFQWNAFEGFELRPATWQANGLVWRTEHFYRWERPQELSSDGAGAHWAMAMELVNESGAACGEFIVYRRSRGEPLQLDVSLIADGFQAELGHAVGRILAGEPIALGGAAALAAAVGEGTRQSSVGMPS